MKTGALEQKTYRELQRLAVRAGIAGRGRMRKSQLVRALQGGRKARPAAPASVPARDRKPVKTVRATARAKGGRQRARARRAPARKEGKQAAALSSTRERLTRLRSGDLPAAYGKTRLVLMEIDPYRVHAYWEVTPESRAAAVARIGGPDAAVAWTLRFFEASGEHDESGSVFDVPVDLAAGNWYVTLPSVGEFHFADLGPVTAGGQFVAACRSNSVHPPRAGTAPHYEPQWLEVNRANTRIATEAVTTARDPVPRLIRKKPAVAPEIGKAAGARAPGTTAPPEGLPGAEEFTAPERVWDGTGVGEPSAIVPELEDMSSFELGIQGRENADDEATAEGGPQRSK